MATQVSLLSGAVASAGSLLLQTNGTTTQATIDTSGNLGLGVTPSAWNSAFKVLQVNSGALVSSSSSYSTRMMSNLYTNSSANDVYQNAGYGLYYLQSISNGQHQWYNAPSGSAGATATMTQAMTLDASGNLGVGTTSPSGKFHVNGGAAHTNAYITTATSSGYDAFLYINGGTTGAIAGVYMGYGADSDEAGIYRDSSSALVFRANNAERARIDYSGNLLVGTTNPSSSAGNGLKVNTTGGVYAVGTAGDTYNFYNSTAAAYRFYVTSAGVINATSTTITAISDQRLKENIEDLDVGLDKIMALQPRKFDWKAGKGKDIKGDRGWIAQEFEQVFPDMIDTWKDPAPEGEEPYKSVRADLIPVLVKALQEMKAIIDDQAARIAALEAK